MIPVIYNEESIWLVGIVWNTEMLAAFLAWWMPLNLISYLLFLVIFSIIDDAEWEPKVFSLRFMLGMPLIFWPWVVGLFSYCAYMVFIHDPRKNRRALR